MKKSLVLILTALLLIVAKCQAQPERNIEAHADTAVITMLSVDAEAYPVITGVVKVMTRNGHPVWGMKKKQVSVSENGIPCRVTAFDPLSEAKPVNIALVVDNSGSMEYELDNVKTSLLPFIRSFDTRKDSICIVTFESIVDTKSDFTSERRILEQRIDQMYAAGGTAFYDAVCHAVDVLRQRSGLRVVIALTDGADNSSVFDLQHTIRHARQFAIPVYVIGYGMLLDEPLQMLADSTGGTYIRVWDPGSLNDIYLAVKDEILAIYSLEFLSQSASTLSDSLRTFYLEIEPGDEVSAVEVNEFHVTLPRSIMDSLKSQERRDFVVLYGGGLLLVGGVVMLIVYVRKKKKRSMYTT